MPVYANNASTVLNGAILAGDTTITVVDASVFPTLTAGGFYWITLDDGSTIEIAQVTGVSGNDLTVTRGQQGTAAAGFADATPVQQRFTASDAEQIVDIGRTIVMSRGTFLP